MTAGTEFPTPGAPDSPFFTYRGRMDFDDYRAYTKAFYRGTKARWSFVFGTGMALLFASLGALAWWNNGPPNLVVMPFIFAAMFYLPVLLHPLRLRWFFRKAERDIEERKVMIGRESLSFESPSFLHVCRWDAVKKVVDTDEGVLILGGNDHPYSWIPARAFPEGGLRSDIVGTALLHGIPVVRASSDRTGF